MINGDSVLAIVPARGGSKRLPRKNVLPLHGKPLIVWSIEAGLRSKYIDKVIVSSEDSEVLEIARNSPAPPASPVEAWGKREAARQCAGHRSTHMSTAGHQLSPG